MSDQRFIEAEKDNHPVACLCRVLEVAPSGFSAWLRREPSERAREDGELTCRIEAIHEGSRGTSGAPRVHAELEDGGVGVGEKRMARLMRALGPRAVHRRRRTRTTRQDRAAAPAPDLVSRDFSASGPDEPWVADITYVPTWAGSLYLAVVLDASSREVVGWAMAGHLRTELVLDALEMAVRTRAPGRGLIHRSDRGSQYASLAFGRGCREAGIVASMGSTGDRYDDALRGSFSATPETELIDRAAFRDQGLVPPPSGGSRPPMPTSTVAPGLASARPHTDPKGGGGRLRSPTCHVVCCPPNRGNSSFPHGAEQSRGGGGVAPVVTPEVGDASGRLKGDVAVQAIEALNIEGDVPVEQLGNRWGLGHSLLLCRGEGEEDWEAAPDRAQLTMKAPLNGGSVPLGGHEDVLTSPQVDAVTEVTSGDAVARLH